MNQEKIQESKDEWEIREKRIGETAKQVAVILAENYVTYNEVPQIFRRVLEHLIVSGVVRCETRHQMCQQCGKEWHYETATYCSGCGRKLEQNGNIS